MRDSSNFSLEVSKYIHMSLFITRLAWYWFIFGDARYGAASLHIIIVPRLDKVFEKVKSCIPLDKCALFLLFGSKVSLGMQKRLIKSKIERTRAESAFDIVL